MNCLGWTYEQFMDSTYYFYCGISQQWLKTNRANEINPSEGATKKVTLDELPELWG